MKAHIDGIKALLEPSGYPVHFGDVVGSPSYPYVLLWTSAGALEADEVDGAQDDLRDLLGVTTVAASPEAALTTVARVRALLLGARPVVPGRYVQRLRLADSRQIEPDRSVKIPSTNRHPVYAVDLYHLISEPV